MAFLRISRVFNGIRAHAPTVRDTSYMLLGFATWIPVFMFANSHVAEVVWINGPSMYPYLNTDFHRTLRKDLCINWKWAPLKDLRRGMIVTFWSPYHPDVQAVKRVIALEGDKVYTRDPYPFPIANVPSGHVWVEGDGGKQSLDSNTYGPISKNLITGQLIYVLWPWNNMGMIRWDQYKAKTTVVRGQLSGQKHDR